uniref:Uncharacterized protein n=1 Tax=Plectus sambesii TaxID=2011161 RepID=A0A914VY54_9BILA
MIPLSFDRECLVKWVCTCDTKVCSSCGDSRRRRRSFWDGGSDERHLLQPPSDSRLRSPEASEPPPSAHFFIGSETANKANRGSFINARQLRERVTTRALMWTQSLRNIRGRKAASAIDERCRYAFPLAFVLFNCLYWTYYMLIST